MERTELTYRTLIDPHPGVETEPHPFNGVQIIRNSMQRFRFGSQSFRFNVFNGTHWWSNPKKLYIQIFIIDEDQWPQKVLSVESQRPLRGARCVRSEVIDAIKTRSWEAQQGTRQQEETFQGACRANNRHHHDPWHPCMIYLTTFTRTK